jgi:hypothetical protein
MLHPTYQSPSCAGAASARFQRQAGKRAGAGGAGGKRLGGGGGSSGGGGGSGLASAPGACKVLVDSTSYLHTRWAADRILATVEKRPHTAPPKFIVVLSDPAERAVRHWRSITGVAMRRPAGLAPVNSV